MKVYRLSMACLLILLVWPSWSGADDGRSDIRVKSYSRVSGNMTYLKDISTITCRHPSCERLKNIEITRSPRPGKKRRMNGSMVEARIKSADPLWQKHVTVSIPKTLVIERDYVEISESEITKVFYQFLEKRAKGRSFRVRDITIRGNRKLAPGTPAYRIDDRNIRDIEGRVSVTVIAKTPSDGNNKIYVSGWVDVFDQVVCTQRDIPRGEVINKSDLVIQRKNLSKIPGGIVLDPKEAEGTIAKTHISAGDYIRSSMIEPAPLVRKGDVVKIVAQSGFLKIVSRGISQENGSLGDQIGVENSRSKKKITGRVVDEGTVQVLF